MARAKALGQEQRGAGGRGLQEAPAHGRGQQEDRRPERGWPSATGLRQGGLEIGLRFCLLGEAGFGLSAWPYCKDGTEPPVVSVSVSSILPFPKSNVNLMSTEASSVLAVTMSSQLGAH